MHIKFMVFILALFVLPSAALAQGQVEKQYNVAVLPFVSEKNKYSDDVAILLNSYLSAKSALIMVERQEINKALSEIEIGKSGLIDSKSAAKVGHLLGAKILVTGRVFSVDQNTVIVAKVIGVEMGRVFGATVTLPSNGTLTDMVENLAKKVNDIIIGKGDMLVKNEDNNINITAILNAIVKDKKLPKVAVSFVSYRKNIQGEDAETAQAEIAYLLQKSGFDVVDETESDEVPDFRVKGKASSEFAMRKGNLVSSKARVEIKVVDVAGKEVVYVDRANESGVDLSARASANQAVVNSVNALIESVVAVLVNKK